MPLLSTRGAASARGFGLLGRVKALADPFFNYVTMLLHGDGTNGAQNNTFLDSSTNNFTITRNGNTTQGSFSPYGPNWSNFFDVANKARINWAFSSSAVQNAVSGTNYTLEFWAFRLPRTGTYQSIFSTENDRNNFIIDSSDNLLITSNGGTSMYTLAANTYIPVNTWTHVALVCSGTTWTLYFNGVSAGTYSGASKTNYGSGTAHIGGRNDMDGCGYLSNFRVSTTARYSGAFTPSTTPFIADGSTAMLTCQSNRFIDTSTNNQALTLVNSPSVQRFSPFAPPAAYNPATIGGSGYFDGSGDYLTVPSNSAFDLGTGDFTVEAWVYRTTSTAGYETLLGFDVAGGMLFQIYQNQLDYGIRATSSTQSGVTVPSNCWVHLAISRQSGTVRQFQNGVLVNSFSNSQNFTNSTQAIVSGFSTSAGQVTGYIANLRLVKGTAVYTATFTLPTAPLTAVSGTSLLNNFTNGAIFDNAMMNNLETVGNAQISTSVVKFGTGSMAFDGSGDYVVEPTNLNFGYGTGDFTIEFWLYLNSTGLQTIVSNLSSGSSTNPHIYITTTIRYYTAGADRITGASLSTGQWYHIALCRASGSTRLFVDGTQSGSTYSDANNYGASAPLGIGTYWDSGAPATSNTLNGYIDDLRITKGVARYTANFTPPTAAFPDQ